MKLIETNLKCCANGTQNLTPFIVTPVQVLSASLHPYVIKPFSYVQYKCPLL